MPNSREPSHGLVTICPADSTFFCKAQGNQVLDSPAWIKQVLPKEDLDLPAAVGTRRKSWICTPEEIYNPSFGNGQWLPRLRQCYFLLLFFDNY